MPQRKKTASLRKRALRAKKKTIKSRTRKKVSTATAEAATSRKRMATGARKKAPPRASTKSSSKGKTSATTGARLQRMQPKRRGVRTESGLRRPRKAPQRKRDSVEVVERFVVDTVEQVAPGVLVVNEYEIEGEAVVTPTNSRDNAVGEPQQRSYLIPPRLRS